MGRSRETYWYALKVFYQKVDLIRDELKKSRHETFVPMIVEEVIGKGEISHVLKPAVASLLFVRCTEKFLLDFRRQKNECGEHFIIYRDLDSGKPGRIPDHEMEVFMMATSAPNPDAQYLGSDTEKYMVGDRVRVTDGPYKGYEGFIRRIKHDRKLLVCVQGIAVVAFSNIDMQNVEKITD